MPDDISSRDGSVMDHSDDKEDVNKDGYEGNENEDNGEPSSSEATQPGVATGSEGKGVERNGDDGDSDGDEGIEKDEESDVIDSDDNNEGIDEDEDVEDEENDFEEVPDDVEIDFAILHKSNTCLQPYYRGS
ncbi:hypothetical protein BGX21_004806 [Mortierella sp. AD011]|nr:hypothetical protein BGX21_004806 [Mortierella sp. AD011]